MVQCTCISVFIIFFLLIRNYFGTVGFVNFMKYEEIKELNLHELSENQQDLCSLRFISCQKQVLENFIYYNNSPCVVCMKKCLKAYLTFFIILVTCNYYGSSDILDIVKIFLNDFPIVMNVRM